MKQETIEYDLLQHIKFCLECKNESQAIRLIEKYGFQKQQEMYSEEDLESAWNSSEQNMRFKFSGSAYRNISFKKWLEIFKKK